MHPEKSLSKGKPRALDDNEDVPTKKEAAP